MVTDNSLAQPRHIFTMTEYREFIKRYWQWLDQPYPGYAQHREERATFYNEYLSHLPVHLLARCPFCGGRAWDRVDTYSLNGPGWWHLGSPEARFHWSDTGDDLESDCGHAQLMSWSINLNGLTPDDLFVGTPGLPLHIRSERPRLMLWPLQVQETRTSAVIHALPIGRYNDPQPQHHYTVYFITYFAEDVQVFRRVAERGDMSIFAFEGVEYDFDLVKWVQVGRLFWLDTRDPELPLRGGLVSAFPYGNVQGHGEDGSIEIIDGQAKFMSNDPAQYK